jgi:hypothetical protein
VVRVLAAAGRLRSPEPLRDDVIVRLLLKQRQ